MDLLPTKILTVVLLWLATFLFGYMPMLLSKVLKRWGQKFEDDRGDGPSTNLLDRLNFVAGGVFLATIFLDLLPEATESLAKALKVNGLTVKVPMTPLIMAIGMLLFMHFEHMTLMLKDYWSSAERGNGIVNGTVTSKEEDLELFSIDTECNNLEADVDDAKTLTDNVRTPRTFYESVPLDNDYAESGALLKKDSTPDLDPGHFDKSGDHVPSPPTDGVTSIESSEESIITHGSHYRTVNTPLRSYILVIALSLHSVFDGIVIGLSNKTSDVWTLFTAVVFHKSLVALSLGSKLLKMSHCISKRTIFFLLLTFTLTTPIGGTIGILMTSSGNKTGSGGLAEGILVSMATGTFTYVTFFEMLKFEGDHRSNLINSFLVTIGFAITATGISFQGDPAETGELQTVSRP